MCQGQISFQKIQTHPSFNACSCYMKVSKGSNQKQQRKSGNTIFPIIRSIGVFLRRSRAANSPTPMMLQIKFGCNRPAGLGDIHVWKCGRTHARTHGRTPARLPSYKLTLWAFGSGELKNDVRPAKTHIRLGICPVWPESSLSTWRKLWSLATQWLHSKTSDQIGWMRVWMGVSRIL